MAYELFSCAQAVRKLIDEHDLATFNLTFKETMYAIWGTSEVDESVSFVLSQLLKEEPQ